MTGTQQGSDSRPMRFIDALTRTVTAAGAAFVYRKLGAQYGGVPLVGLTHLGANLDSWDPELVDPLAQHRRVVLLGYRGVGASTGTVRDRFEDMAADAIAAIRELGLPRVDLSGLAMGGMVTQEILHQAPELVERVILAGTGPQGGPGLAQMTSVTIRTILRGVVTFTNPTTLLFFTHTPTGRQAARTYSRVRGFKAGDRVYARPRDYRIGTFAERIAVDEADVALAPTTISAAEAASLPLVALTAWQALVEKGGVAAGQRVLIHAGAGGVGSIAIQLAKHLGAQVATTVSAKNADFVRELGADVVIDYRTQDFEHELSGYDFVLDSLGGDTLLKSLRVLRPGGKAVGIFGVPDPAFSKAAGLNLFVRLAIAGLSRKTRALANKLGVSYEFLFMRASGEQLQKITALIDADIIRPVVGATFPFEQTPQALSELGKTSIRGKAVVTGPDRPA